MLAQSIEEIYDVNETYIFYKRNGLDLAYNKSKQIKIMYHERILFITRWVFI